jgi:hypothetical protein
MKLNLSTKSTTIISMAALMLSSVMCLSTIGNNSKYEPQSVSFKLRHPTHQPVSFTGFKYGITPVSEERPFTADQDWLKSFNIQIKNISKKTIKYLSVEISFPQKDDGTFLLPNIIFFKGKNLLLPSHISQPQEDLTLPTKEEITLLPVIESIHKLSASIVEKKLPKSIIGKVTIAARIVVFDDDTCWMDGIFYKRSENNAYEWGRIDDLESFINEPIMQKISANKNMQDIPRNCFISLGFFIFVCTDTCFGAIPNLKRATGTGNPSENFEGSCMDIQTGQPCADGVSGRRLNTEVNCAVTLAPEQRISSAYKKRSADMATRQ